jgi:hypothetical protein
MSMFNQDKLVKVWAKKMEWHVDLTMPEIFQYYDCLNVFTICGGPLEGNLPEVRREYKARRDWCRANLQKGDYTYWRKHGMDHSYIITSFRNRNDALRFRLVWMGETVELEQYR